MAGRRQEPLMRSVLRLLDVWLDSVQPAPVFPRPPSHEAYRHLTMILRGLGFTNEQERLSLREAVARAQELDLGRLVPLIEGFANELCVDLGYTPAIYEKVQEDLWSLVADLRDKATLEGYPADPSDPRSRSAVAMYTAKRLVMALHKDERIFAVNGPSLEDISFLLADPNANVPQIQKTPITNYPHTAAWIFLVGCCLVLQTKEISAAKIGQKTPTAQIGKKMPIGKLLAAVEEKNPTLAEHLRGVQDACADLLAVRWPKRDYDKQKSKVKVWLDLQAEDKLPTKEYIEWLLGGHGNPLSIDDLLCDCMGALINDVGPILAAFCLPGWEEALSSLVEVREMDASAPEASQPSFFLPSFPTLYSLLSDTREVERYIGRRCEEASLQEELAAANSPAEKARVEKKLSQLEKRLNKLGRVWQPPPGIYGVSDPTRLLAQTTPGRALVRGTLVELLARYDAYASESGFIAHPPVANEANAEPKNVVTLTENAATKKRNRDRERIRLVMNHRDRYYRSRDDEENRREDPIIELPEALLAPTRAVWEVFHYCQALPALDLRAKIERARARTQEKRGPTTDTFSGTLTLANASSLSFLEPRLRELQVIENVTVSMIPTNPTLLSVVPVDSSAVVQQGGEVRWEVGTLMPGTHAPHHRTRESKEIRFVVHINRWQIEAVSGGNNANKATLSVLVDVPAWKYHPEPSLSITFPANEAAENPHAPGRSAGGGRSEDRKYTISEDNAPKELKGKFTRWVYALHGLQDLVDYPERRYYERQCGQRMLSFLPLPDLERIFGPPLSHRLAAPGSDASASAIKSWIAEEAFWLQLQTSKVLPKTIAVLDRRLQEWAQEVQRADPDMADLRLHHFYLDPRYRSGVSGTALEPEQEAELLLMLDRGVASTPVKVLTGKQGEGPKQAEEQKQAEGSKGEPEEETSPEVRVRENLGDFGEQASESRENLRAYMRMEAAKRRQGGGNDHGMVN